MSKPAICPRCTATSNEDAEEICIPCDGACPIVDAGFTGVYWPREDEFAAFAEETC